MIQPVQIGQFLVGPGHPCFIIAEAGVNHNGEIELAKRLIEEAKAAGADAVKFQTYSTEAVIVKDAPKASYQLQTSDVSESQFEMLERLRLTHQEFAVLKAYADDLGILFLSTPSDKSDIDFLMSIAVPALKVASMDLVNFPHLEDVGRQGSPVILSTGMATLGEVEAGVEALAKAGCSDIVIMHCITSYPAKDEDANLRVLKTLRQAFHLPVGFSDHTLGIYASIAAVALGAVTIEKHFTLDSNMSGPDHAASLDPARFKEMVEGIRVVEKALGSSVKKPTAIELKNRQTMRRSLVAALDLPAGTVLEDRHLALKRPGDGYGAEFIPFLVGKKLRQFTPKNTRLNLGDVI